MEPNVDVWRRWSAAAFLSLIVLLLAFLLPAEERRAARDGALPLTEVHVVALGGIESRLAPTSVSSVDILAVVEIPFVV